MNLGVAATSCGASCAIASRGGCVGAPTVVSTATLVVTGVSVCGLSLAGPSTSASGPPAVAAVSARSSADGVTWAHDGARTPRAVGDLPAVATCQTAGD